MSQTIPRGTRDFRRPMILLSAHPDRNRSDCTNCPQTDYDVLAARVRGRI